MRSGKNGPESSASQISRAYVALLVTLMTVISLSIVGVVGLRLFNARRDDANQLMRTLKVAFNDYQPDWDYWRDTASLNTRATFVRIEVEQPKQPLRIFYSRRTKQFLHQTTTVYPVSRHIRYQENQGLFYHKVDTVKKGTATVTYEIWLSLNNAVTLLQTIVLVIVGLTLVGSVIGIILIRVLAKRLNQPLVNLTQAAQHIVESQDVTYHETLPVPNGPSEVHDLSLEFNRLLQSLNQQVIRDHQFVSDASHELRTPLAAVRGHVALIQRHAEQHPEVVAPSLVTIDEASLKMQHLIDRLLQLSRMDHEQLARDWFDLTATVQQVVARYADQGQQPIQLHAPKQVLAYGHVDSVEQILVALVNNAQKYAPRQSLITVTIQQSTNRAFVTVADLGPGVPDADKARIFDRFYRVDASRSHQVAGTGLGLAIASRLAKLNQGQLVVTDNVPKGSKFTLTLPGTTTFSEKNSE